MKDRNIMASILESYLNKVNYSFVVKKYSAKQLIMMIALMSIVSILLCTYGCSSQDDTPLGSLGSTKISNKYNYSFWWNEAKKNSSLWSSAADYCKTPANSNNVNCSNVNEINMLININTDAPTANPNSKEFATIPTFGH